MREVWEARPVLAKSYVNVSVFSQRGGELPAPCITTCLHRHKQSSVPWSWPPHSPPFQAAAEMGCAGVFLRLWYQC